MKTIDINCDELLNFLNQSPTQFHAAREISTRLKENGYQELHEQDHWDMKPNGRYFVQRNASAIIAWKLTDELLAPKPLNIALAHLDSPGLRLKMRSLTQRGNSLVAPVEKYSSNIDTTWMDHPLTVAGRVILNSLEQRLVHGKYPMAVIPNIATHLQRDINQGIHLNPQVHLTACLGNATPQDFINAIAQLADTQPQHIADLELALVDATPAAVVGLNRDLINAPRLDNLLASHALMTAMIQPQQPTQNIALAFFADNEEIGSNTPQGADSAFLRDTIQRINIAQGGNQETMLRALAQSYLVSVDAAHAFHPNYPEKYDPTTAAQINAGIALKANPNGRYITTAPTKAWFEKMCKEENVPCQFFAVRADMPCGSTVGPTTAARLGIQGVDVGNPMWAMHSVRETAGLKDQTAMATILNRFLNL